MKKNKFIKSVLILTIGGIITKILGMIIKIVLTRKIGVEGIGLYMMVMPTYTLLISISNLGFPVAISKLVAEEKHNNKNLVLGIIPISLIINFLVIIFLFIFSPFISNNLLRENKTYLSLISIGFILPFVSISSILRGYFFGREKMIPHVVSNILEDLIRLLIIIKILPLIMPKGISVSVAFVFLISIISELSSIIIFIICLPKKISVREFIPNKKNIRSVLDISLPTTGSRLIGSIGYFLEPIILNYVLYKVGYSSNFILKEYGILNGYVMPLLLLPSFFTLAISQALIPIISKSYSNKNYLYTIKKIKQAIILSLIIGLPCTLIFLICPSIPLNLIYNTNLGINYIRFLAPIILIYYIQTPIVSSLQAMNKAKLSMKGTLYGMIIRTIILFSFSHLKIGIWGLVLAISINIIFVTLYDIKNIKKILRYS